MQRQSVAVHDARRRASEINDRAAQAHRDAHKAHTEALEHPLVGEHREEHKHQAAHHLTEANRHTVIAHQYRQGVDRPALHTQQHIEEAKNSFLAADKSGAKAAESHSHAGAAVSHLRAAGEHQSVHDAHRTAASMTTHPGHIQHHSDQAGSHKKQMNEHLRSAAAHSPSHQNDHGTPKPDRSKQQANDSRAHAEAAGHHMAAASLHQELRDYHLSLASGLTHPGQKKYQKKEAETHEGQMNAHHQYAFEHAPHHENRPDPKTSYQHAESSRVTAAQKLWKIRKPAPAPRRPWH